MAGPIRISILADDRASRVFGSVGGQVGMLSGRVGKYGKAMGIAVAGGAVVAGAATVKWASDSVSSLARIERINTQTQAAIKSTGGAANVSSKHVENLAGRLENLTATEAETTQENANLLLTFTNVQNQAGKGNKIFDRATKTFVDMQRAIPSASMTSLGKALNDPVKGISALTRVGVSFTDQQKRQITSLSEHNKTMEAQKIILGELTKEFGGSGEAFAKTAEGQKALLGHAFGTLGETIFAPLLPWMTKVTGEATVLVNYLNENVGPAFTTVQGYIAPVVDVLAGLFDTAGSGNSMLATSIAGVTGAYAGFYSAVWPIILALSDGIREQWGTIGPDVEHIFTSVQNTIRDALSAVTSIIKGVTAGVLLIWSKWGDTLTNFTVTSLKNVISALRGAFEIVEGVFKVISSALKGDWSGVWDGIQKILTGALRIITASLSQAWNMISTAASIAWDLLKTIIAKAWDAAVDAVQAGIKAEVDLLKSLPGRIKNAVGDLGGILLDAGRAVIQGLIDGIEDKVGDLTGKLSAITDKIPDWKGPAPKDRALLRPVGRMIIAGLIKGFEDGEAGVKSSLEKITDLIRERVDLKDDGKEKARENAIIAALRGQYDALTQNGKAQDRINAALDKARDKLKAARDQAKAYADAVSSAVISAGDVTTVGVTDDGDQSVGTIMAGLGAQLRQTQAFTDALAQLKGLGINDTAYDQIVQQSQQDMGAALATVQALLAGGSTGVAAVNSLQQQLADAAAALGQQTSSSLYSAGIDAAESLVAGLEKRAKRFQNIADSMADRLIKRLEKALGLRETADQDKGKGKNPSTADKSAAAAAATAATAARTAAPAPVPVNITVVAPVGSSPADIGRELQRYLEAYLDNGGRALVTT